MNKHVPFRFDYVGSFLRPQELRDARTRFQAGAITAEQLKEAEDRAIRKLVERQKAEGYHVITDGEFRRATWHLDFMWGFDGVGHSATKTGLPFHDEAAMIDDTYLTGKVGLSGELLLSLTSVSLRHWRTRTPSPSRRSRLPPSSLSR